MNDLACAVCGWDLGEAQRRMAASTPPPPLSSTPTPMPPRARPALGTLLGVAVPSGAEASLSPRTALPYLAGRHPSEPPRPPGLPPGLAASGLAAALRPALERTYRAPAEIVAETVLRHGLATLTDRPLLEQEMWAEFARDVRLILCALEEGVPQRLALRLETLSERDVQQQAQALAEARGLAEEAAEYAVAAWASALRGLM